jgi:hypothetical protein
MYYQALSSYYDPRQLRGKDSCEQDLVKDPSLQLDMNDARPVCRLGLIASRSQVDTGIQRVTE